jgi:LPXTG-motif cell wall-anchored protein
MPGYRRRLAALVAAGLLAAPATALGQSAGDDQYEDPFAGEQQSQGGESEEPSAAPTPEPAAPGAEPELQPVPESGPAPASQPQLPRTGADTGAILIAGAILLAGGVALRLRLRDRA